MSQAGTPDRVRCHLVAADMEALTEFYGAELAAGSLFVRQDHPPSVGTPILLEFGPDALTLVARVHGAVAHARTAPCPGAPNAGMQVVLTELDANASLAAFPSAGAAKNAPPQPPPLFQSPSIRPSQGPGLLRRQGPVLGIDLGTFNTSVAIMERTGPRPISSMEGYTTLPAVVLVGSERQMLVGHPALEQMLVQPEHTIVASKLFLGRPFDSRPVHDLRHFFSYRLVADAKGMTAAKVGPHVVPLVDVSAAILGAARQMAVHALGQPISRAVIAVPAYFGEAQREAVREAGRLAGLFVERLINEPTAAAVGYGLSPGPERILLVYDLGSTTFDVSLLKVAGDSIEVLATDGDPLLGGQDFDSRLLACVLEGYAQQYPDSQARQDPAAMQRLSFAVQAAKHQLSETKSAVVELPAFEHGRVLKAVIDRQLLEAETQDLVARSLHLVDRALARAQLTPAQVDEVLLVGGQTCSPHVHRSLSAHFGRSPAGNVHPTQAVALGAAAVGELAQRRMPAQLLEVLPASIRLGIADSKTQVLLAQGTPLPASKTFDIAVPHRASQVQVVLCRGEAASLSDNGLLGVLQVPLPALSARRIRVTLCLRLAVDVQGLLSVSASADDEARPQALEVALSH